MNFDKKQIEERREAIQHTNRMLRFSLFGWILLVCYWFLSMHIAIFNGNITMFFLSFGIAYFAYKMFNWWYFYHYLKKAIEQNATTFGE